MSEKATRPCLLCGCATEGAGVIATERPAIFPCCKFCEKALAANEGWAWEKLRNAKREPRKTETDN
jgi:hypothetical protein